MIEVRIVQEQDLTSDMAHVYTWNAQHTRDAYFDKKKYIKHMATFQGGPNLTTLNVDYSIDELANYDYLYFSCHGKRYFYFIENKIFKTVDVTTLVLSLDYWTTYQFDIDLNTAFVERCHQDRWKKTKNFCNLRFEQLTK